MRMRPTRAAHSARRRSARAGRSLRRVLATARSENRELFGQAFGTALRTRRSFPMAGADENFGIRPAFSAVELINRHGLNIGDFASAVKVNVVACAAALTLPAQGPQFSR